MKEKMINLLIYATSTKSTTVVWQLHVFPSEVSPCILSLLKNKPEENFPFILATGFPEPLESWMD